MTELIETYQDFALELFGDGRDEDAKVMLKAVGEFALKQTAPITALKGDK